MVDAGTFAGPGAHIHIVGIGGAGMSAIARVLLGRGVRISGSDRQESPLAEALKAYGAKIFEGHAAGNVAGADALLISSAIRDDNPEVMAARAAQIPVLKRREALPLLMGDKMQIAVAGTHGKTTTTALITHLLREAGKDPSYIIGGVLGNTGDNARAGTGEAFVIEADEYDYMFLGLSPTIAVLTNIEMDHPDMFPSLDKVVDTFREFVAQIPPYDGVLIACGDDPNALALARERRASGQPTLTYSLGNPQADWTAAQVKGAWTVRGVQNGHSRTWKIPYLAPPLAGDHNVRNMVAGLAACVAAGVPIEEVIPGLGTFRGTGRRFEILGESNLLRVISDYGHHPTAIKTTLNAARRLHSTASLWAIWQPHTFSRTRKLADEFAHAFAEADHVMVMDIYASREVRGDGDPDGAELARRIREAGHPDARYTGDVDSTAKALIAALGRDDIYNVVIIFSAGDAPRVGEMLLANRQ